MGITLVGADSFVPLFVAVASLVRYTLLITGIAAFVIGIAGVDFLTFSANV